MNVLSPVKASVSGSFGRHLGAMYEIVQELGERGVVVLSPADMRVVDAIGPFLVLAGDPVRSIRRIQDHHLAAIKASDFLLLVAPDGYVGVSAAMEVGYAIAVDVPVFSLGSPNDPRLRAQVSQVSDIPTLLAEARLDAACEAGSMGQLRAIVEGVG